MSYVPALAPVAKTRPGRRVDAIVFNSGNSSPLAALPDVAVPDGAIRFREGVGSQERLELVLPRRLGTADIQNELYSTGALALGNYLRLYVSDWRTLSGQQADAATSRPGSTAAALSRVRWTGIIRSISTRPDRIVFRAVAALAGAATGGQAHHIGYGCLLDWDLELSDYRSPGTVDYTGWIEVSHEAYDTGAINLGDSVTVGEDRVLNVDSNTRYNAYGDNPRTVYSLEWGARGCTVQFDARTPDLVNDQLTKLTEMTRTASTNTVTATDQFVASGGLTTKTVMGAPTDGSVGTPTDGTLLLDESTDRLYLRTNGVWKYVTLT